MLICEMTAYYKNEGKTLIDVLNELYEKYGYYSCSQKSFTCEGQSGMEKIKNIMDTLRKAPPKYIIGQPVVTVKDYENSVSTNTLNGTTEKIILPKSNVLAYHLADGSSAIVRPSGTEPKIKLYIEAVGVDSKDALNKRTEIENSGTALLGF